MNNKKVYTVKDINEFFTNRISGMIATGFLITDYSSDGIELKRIDKDGFRNVVTLDLVLDTDYINENNIPTYTLWVDSEADQEFYSLDRDSSEVFTTDISKAGSGDYGDTKKETHENDFNTYEGRLPF